MITEIRFDFDLLKDRRGADQALRDPFGTRDVRVVNLPRLARAQQLGGDDRAYAQAVMVNRHGPVPAAFVADADEVAGNARIVGRNEAVVLLEDRHVFQLGIHLAQPELFGDQTGAATGIHDVTRPRFAPLSGVFVTHAVHPLIGEEKALHFGLAAHADAAPLGLLQQHRIEARAIHNE